MPRTAISFRVANLPPYPTGRRRVGSARVVAPVCRRIEAFTVVVGEMVEGRFGDRPAHRSAIRPAFTVDHCGEVEVAASRSAAAPRDRGRERTFRRHQALVRVGREPFDASAGGLVGSQQLVHRYLYQYWLIVAASAGVVVGPRVDGLGVELIDRGCPGLRGI